MKQGLLNPKVPASEREETSVINIKKNKLTEWFYGYLFILPTIIGLGLFFFWPVINCFVISFYKWDGMGVAEFIGFQNFLKLFKDPKVWNELGNTFYYTIAMVPISICLSIVLANVLNSKLIRLKSMFKIIYFLPCITMATAIALIWRWLFNSEYGLVNIGLSWIGITGPMWLSDPKWLMPAIIIIGIWSSLGYNMILILAGLQGVSRTYYESAEIDGASAFNKFFYITIPLLSPTIFFISITSFINAFKMFDTIFMFAGNSTGVLLDSIKTMVYGIYQNGFVFNRMGYASAEAVVLCLIILAFTAIQFLAQKKWVYYD